MENKRYWIVSGQKVYVNNRLHNFLGDSRNRIITKDNIEAEHRVFSLDEETSDIKLEEMHAATPAFDEQLLVQMILEDALQNISKHSQTILRAVYYEHISVSEYARRTGVHVKRMQRDVKKALCEMKTELEKYGIMKMGDLM